MSIKSVISFTVLLAILLSGCTLNQQQSVATSPPAEVVAKQILPTETLPPPTDTPLPTDTPMPTNTPLPTATPGPVVFKDDFSTQTDNWGDCDKCEWRDGFLLFGPHPPKSGSDQNFYIICNTCGLHTYYRASVDATYIEGMGLPYFGVLAGLTEDKTLIAGGTVTIFKHAVYLEFDYLTGQYNTNGVVKEFNAVRAGRATNRIVVEIRPASNPGLADIDVSVNKTTVLSLLDQSIEPSWAGLYLAWHSVAVSYDNFEYEEIQVK